MALTHTHTSYHMISNTHAHKHMHTPPATERLSVDVDASGVATSVTTLADRVKGALFGMLIFDAMAMPSHWFYGGARQVASTYGGPIKGYLAPAVHLPNSIMSKANTGGGGRGSFSGNIIGKGLCTHSRHGCSSQQEYLCAHSDFSWKEEVLETTC